jgi:hypothetical protein
MAGALMALRIPQRVVQQFDRNVIFCRFRGADFAAFMTVTADEIFTTDFRHKGFNSRLECAKQRLRLPASVGSE